MVLNASLRLCRGWCYGRQRRSMCAMAREQGLYWVRNRLGQWTFAAYESDGFWRLLDSKAPINGADIGQHFKDVGPRFDSLRIGAPGTNAGAAA